MKAKGDLLLAAFVVAFVAYATVASLLTSLGASYWDAPLKISIIFALYLLFPEPSSLGWGRRAWILMLVVALLLSVIWIFYSELRGRSDSDMAIDASVVYPLLNIIVVTPVFEEKMVRHLLFMAFSSWLNGVLAAIFVSALFALSHYNVFLWAFIASMALCWMFRKMGANSIQCALVHGVLNLVVTLTYLL